MSGKCKPVIIPNEFITTLLSPSETKELHSMNVHLTNKVLDCVCPTLDPSINRLLPPLNKPLIKDNKNKDKKHCYYCDPITPTNTILYGSTICQDLLILNTLGVNNYEIKLLNNTHNVVWPWSIQYHADRLGNNKRLQYFPLIIAFPKSAKEVEFWVNFAVKHSILPCIRSGGHNYEGFSCSNPLIIDTTDLMVKCYRCNNVSGYKDNEVCAKPYYISKSRNFVDVSPGVRLGPLYHELGKHELIIAGGICPSVCVGGLVAGGGVGYFMRQFGYACDNLLEADIVLASGHKITCTADNKYSDLFRALKGAGGGNFGVITRYRLRTHKVKKVVYFTYFFSGSDTVSVLDALQRVGIDAPDLLSGIVGNLVAGIGGIAVNGIYNAVDSTHPLEEFNLFINKYFFSLMSGVVPVSSDISYKTFVEIDIELGSEAPPLPFYKIKSSYSFNLLSRADLQKIVDSVSVPPPTGRGIIFLAMQNLVYGGFVNRVNPKSSVLVARAGTKGWYQMAVYYTDPNDLDIAISYINSVYNVVASLTSTYADANVSDMALTNPLESYYGAGNIPFLIDTKKKYDPNNVFTFPQSIPVV